MPLREKREPFREAAQISARREGNLPDEGMWRCEQFAL